MLLLWTESHDRNDSFITIVNKKKLVSSRHHTLSCCLFSSGLSDPEDCQVLCVLWQHEFGCETKKANHGSCCEVWGTLWCCDTGFPLSGCVCQALYFHSYMKSVRNDSTMGKVENNWNYNQSIIWKSFDPKRFLFEFGFFLAHSRSSLVCSVHFVICLQQ